ncbi:MAG: LamG domain-containing protein [Cytophagales bacterium]|nr:LamG domain-containing protein [Cytophagales bacterium]
MKTGKVKLLLYGVMLLLTAGVIYSCSKDDAVPVVDKAALKTAITAANTLHDGALEGVAAGNYLKGSKAVFKTSITAAQGVVDNAATTQIQVTAGAATLADAVVVFNGKLVTPIDPTNLAGHWTFDEIPTASVGAVVKDYSGNSRNGAIKIGHAFWGAGTPTLAPDRYGIAGKALYFNLGANVEIPYSTGLNPPNMSISVWAKPDVNSPILNNQYFISMNRWNGWKFNFQDTPRAFFTTRWDNAGLTNQCCYDRDQNVGTAPQGEWHNYVVTFGGGNTTFYIDGVLVFQFTNTPGTITTLLAPVALVLGQDLPTGAYSLVNGNDNYVNWGGYYKGVLDEVRVYKSILTAAQVTSIYNLEKP